MHDVYAESDLFSTFTDMPILILLFRDYDVR